MARYDYEKDKDYMALMQAAADKENYADAAIYEQQRNAKIAGEGMNYAPTHDYEAYLPREDNPAFTSGKDAPQGYNDAAIDALLTQINGGGKTNPATQPYMQMLQRELIGGSPSPSYGGSTWDARAKDALIKAATFSYGDYLKSDEYGALSKQYGAKGQRAMENTLAEIAARTGGMASSYAGTAAQQAYDKYMEGLADEALSRYDAERNALYKAANEYQGLADTDYQRYLQAYQRQQNDRNYRVGLIGDLMGAARQADNDMYARQQAADNLAYQRAQADMNDARGRVDNYLKSGGDPAKLDPAIVEASGYTPAEIAAAQAYYAQQAQLAAQKAAKSSSGGGSGSGSGSGKPTLTAAQALKAVNDGIYTDKVLDAYEYYYGERPELPQEEQEIDGGKQTDDWNYGEGLDKNFRKTLPRFATIESFDTYVRKLVNSGDLDEDTAADWLGRVSAEWEAALKAGGLNPGMFGKWFDSNVRNR